MARASDQVTPIMRNGSVVRAGSTRRAGSDPAGAATERRAPRGAAVCAAVVPVRADRATALRTTAVASATRPAPRPAGPHQLPSWPTALASDGSGEGSSPWQVARPNFPKAVAV